MKIRYIWNRLRLALFLLFATLFGVWAHELVITNPHDSHGFWEATTKALCLDSWLWACIIGLTGYAFKNECKHWQLLRACY
jgi:hypothetical protein